MIFKYIRDIFRNPTLREKKEKDLAQAQEMLREAILLGEHANSIEVMALGRIDRLTDELSEQPLDLKEANALLQRVS